MILCILTHSFYSSVKSFAPYLLLISSLNLSTMTDTNRFMTKKVWMKMKTMNKIDAVNLLSFLGPMSTPYESIILNNVLGHPSRVASSKNVIIDHRTLSKLLNGTIHSLSVSSPSNLNLPIHLALNSIVSSLQYPSYPLNIYTPRIPNTKRNRILINATLNRLGIACSRELTIVFMPSSFDIILSGRRALKALKPLKNVKLVWKKKSKNQFKIEDKTIIKSNMFQESFR